MNEKKVRDLTREFLQALAPSLEGRAAEIAQELAEELTPDESTYTAMTVRRLREESGSGMMDCKKALDEAHGDYDLALHTVRTRGLC